VRERNSDVQNKLFLSIKRKEKSANFKTELFQMR